MRVHALGPGPRRWLCVFALILALGIAGCSSNQSKPQARPTTSTARQVTTTVASTNETPAPTSAPPTTGPPTTSEATRTTSADPATVVREYFAAINARDYPRAFELGGKNFDNSYSHFVDGFANTEHDAVTVLGVDGPNVTVLLVATDNAGRRSVYQGTYTVENGQLKAAKVHRLPPQTSTTAPPGTGNCDPSYTGPNVCLHDGIGDYDCKGSGNGPNFVEGPIKVVGPDQFHLDRDHDGIACES